MAEPPQRDAGQDLGQHPGRPRELPRHVPYHAPEGPPQPEADLGEGFLAKAFAGAQGFFRQSAAAAQQLLGAPAGGLGLRHGHGGCGAGHGAGARWGAWRGRR